MVEKIETVKKDVINQGDPTNVTPCKITIKWKEIEETNL